MHKQRRLLILATSLSCLTSTGCVQLGVLMHHAGLGPKEKIEAKYELPERPVVILVDDDLSLVQPPVACQALVDMLAIELKSHELVDRVTTNEELAELKSSVDDFSKLSIRQVGRSVQADVVLWVSVEDFRVPTEADLIAGPARFVVRVKVFDANAQRRQDVRLWPDNRQGQYLTVVIEPHNLQRYATIPAMHHALAEEMADKIAKLFYTYTIEAT
jgi:hypothetical protein